jgi:hypothetical protein
MIITGVKCVRVVLTGQRILPMLSNEWRMTNMESMDEVVAALDKAENKINQLRGDIAKAINVLINKIEIIDKERALADQMAMALAAVKADRPTAHTDKVWSAVCDALAAYEEARRG